MKDFFISGSFMQLVYNDFDDYFGFRITSGDADKRSKLEKVPSGV
jgi:hypothetical protein